MESPGALSSIPRIDKPFLGKLIFIKKYISLLPVCRDNHRIFFPKTALLNLPNNPPLKERWFSLQPAVKKKQATKKKEKKCVF